MSRMIFLAAAVSLVATGTAAAGPRSIDDCEKIEAADAYNRCLASFGPVASGRARASAPVSAAPAQPRAGRRGERLRMVITPGGGRR